MTRPLPGSGIYVSQPGRLSGCRGLRSQNGALGEAWFSSCLPLTRYLGSSSLWMKWGGMVCGFNWHARGIRHCWHYSCWGPREEGALESLAGPCRSSHWWRAPPGCPQAVSQGQEATPCPAADLRGRGQMDLLACKGRQPHPSICSAKWPKYVSCKQGSQPAASLVGCGKTESLLEPDEGGRRFIGHWVSSAAGLFSRGQGEIRSLCWRASVKG